MRYTGLALFASAVFLGACGGGADTHADSTPAATSTPAAAAATMMPITGTTHTVNMVMDDKGYHFVPAEITVKAGDGIKFVTVSGEPHNVGFNPADIPEDMRAQLAANMEKTDLPMTSPMIMAVGETFTISFAGIKPGKYPVNCPVHLALGMKGTITVE